LRDMALASDGNLCIQRTRLEVSQGPSNPTAAMASASSAPMGSAGSRPIVTPIFQVIRRPEKPKLKRAGYFRNEGQYVLPCS